MSERIIRWLGIIAALLALGGLLHFAAQVFIPLFVAVLLAYLLDPLVTWLEHRIKSRTTAVVLTLAASFILFLSLLAIFTLLVFKINYKQCHIKKETQARRGKREQPAERMC